MEKIYCAKIPMEVALKFKKIVIQIIEIIILDGYDISGR